MEQNVETNKKNPRTTGTFSLVVTQLKCPATSEDKSGFSLQQCCHNKTDFRETNANLSSSVSSAYTAAPDNYSGFNPIVLSWNQY